MNGDPYRIHEWGAPYFGVSDAGEVEVRLGAGDAPRRMSLLRMVHDLHERGYQPPFILRFPDILDARLSLLHETFREQIREQGYGGGYRGVYPVKVNQQQQVVEEVVRFGTRYHHGLEVGSKAELIAALSYLQDRDALLVCNGYKDRRFMDLAWYGRTIGLRAVPIIEMPSELDLMIRRARALGVEPEFGVRIKLASPGSGHWVESGGDQSVFGLHADQILSVVDRLRDEGLLDRLTMLHFHLGSQIPDIQTIRTSVEEAARLYVGLVREGARMGILNIGGGLAVDYDGSQSSAAGSRNYDVREYCADVIEVLKNTLDEEGVEHPTVVSESGRSIVAHYAVLVFNVLDVAVYAPVEEPAPVLGPFHEYTHSLADLEEALTEANLQESYNDAVFYRDQLRRMFTLGRISLRERGEAERICNRLLKRIARQRLPGRSLPDGLRDLARNQADIYYGNFSLFQSLPDSWAIHQLFPILPIHRLNEPPEHEGVFADITCDCDGKIDRFIDAGAARRTLPLHALRPGEPYYIGAFLIGAYQETLGDLHNLFGDPNVISVQLDDEGQLEYSQEVEGDTVSDVLSYVEFDPKAMRVRFRAFVERAVRQGRITAAMRREVLEAYDEGMRSSTYVHQA